MAPAPTVIESLTSEMAIKIAMEKGPEWVHNFLRLKNDVHEGKAWRAQEQAFKDLQNMLPSILEKIEPREIKVINQAFNASSDYSKSFQHAALGAMPLAVLAIAAAIQVVGSSLEGIQSELAISNVATVQGWNGVGFGSYVHRFVRNEMRKAALRPSESASTRYHFFYVWHPDSDWHPVFEERQAEDPLESAFGGYHHDLATICLRMRADREVLIRTTEYGKEAMFHLIIPSYSPIVLDRCVVFADALLPLVITGTRHRGVDLVWLRFGKVQEQLRVQHLGGLPETLNPVAAAGTGTWVLSMLGLFGGSIAMSAFPPCAPAVALAMPALEIAVMGSGATVASAVLYEGLTQEDDQVLGDAVFF